MERKIEWNAPWMTEEHLMFKESTRRFFEAELSPHTERWAEQGEVDRDFWYKAGEAGLLGASAPEELGGAGGDHSFDAIIGHEQARSGDSGWRFGVHNICMHYIIAYANEEQKVRWMPGLNSGEIVPAVAMTEPGTGSDLQAVRTSADIAAYPWVRGWKWSKVDITGHANVVAWVDRVRACPAVERGLSYDFAPDEIDSWSEETRKRYAASGASIASNESISSVS